MFNEGPVDGVRSGRSRSMGVEDMIRAVEWY